MTTPSLTQLVRAAEALLQEQQGTDRRTYIETMRRITSEMETADDMEASALYRDLMQLEVPPDGLTDAESDYIAGHEGAAGCLEWSTSGVLPTSVPALEAVRREVLERAKRWSERGRYSGNGQSLQYPYEGPAGVHDAMLMDTELQERRKAEPDATQQSWIKHVVGELLALQAPRWLVPPLTRLHPGVVAWVMGWPVGDVHVPDSALMPAKTRSTEAPISGTLEPVPSGPVRVMPAGHNLQHQGIPDEHRTPGLSVIVAPPRQHQAAHEQTVDEHFAELERARDAWEAGSHPLSGWWPGGGF